MSVVRTVASVVAVAATVGLSACSAAQSGNPNTDTGSAATSAVSDSGANGARLGSEAGSDNAGGNAGPCAALALAGKMQATQDLAQGKGEGTITLTNFGHEPCSISANYLTLRMLSMRNESLGEAKVTAPSAEPVVIAVGEAATLGVQWPAKTSNECLPPPAMLHLYTMPEDKPTKVEINNSTTEMQPCGPVQIVSIKHA